MKNFTCYGELNKVEVRKDVVRKRWFFDVVKSGSVIDTMSFTFDFLYGVAEAYEMAASIGRINYN